VNDAKGLEQWFQLDRPPGRPASSGQPLVLAMEVSGELKPTLAEDGRSVLFQSADGERRLRYDKLLAWDATQSQLPSRLAVRQGQVQIEIDDTDAVYPLTIDPLFSAEQEITANDGTEGDTLGRALAVNESTAVIGAPYADDKGSRSGAVYVFVRNGNSWTQQQKLKAFDGVAEDFFGSSVVINGDTLSGIDPLNRPISSSKAGPVPTGRPFRLKLGTACGKFQHE
jgi:hypothetical protein